MKRILLILAVLTFISSRGWAQDIQTILQQRVNSDRNGASIVVAVVDERKTSFFNYGKTAKLENVLPSDEQTVFEIGSVTKVFTGILLAEGVRRGEVRLEDPLSRHLPRNVSSPQYNGKEITLIQLISHTSGLPSNPDNLKPSNSANPYADYSVNELYEFLGKSQLKREPGSQFEYSNLGVGLLSHTLCLRAKTTYEKLVKTRILQPLGMRDTGIALTGRMKSHLAVGYNGDGDPAANWDLPTLAGAGALRSTAADLAKFISANLGLRKTEIWSALVEAQRFAWVRRRSGKSLLFHGGSTDGYLCFVVIDNFRRKGVAVIANSQDPIEDIGFHIIDNSSPLRPVPAARTQITLADEVLERYVGEYELKSLNLIMTVTRKGGRLFLQTANDVKGHLLRSAQFGLYPEKENEFFLKVVDATITFTRDDNGKVTGLILHQKGNHVGTKTK